MNVRLGATACFRKNRTGARAGSSPARARSVQNSSAVRPRDGSGAGRQAARAVKVRRGGPWMGWPDSFIAEALVVPLGVVVRQKLVDGVAQTSFSEKNEPIEPLCADRAHEPLA